MAVDGKPAITTPGQLVLRPVQASIAAARQRIEKLEAAVTILQNAGTTSFDAVIQSLRISIAHLQTQVALLSGGIFDPQSAHLVFAGPTSGTPDEPTFRALVQDDLPDISALSAQSGGLGGDELVAVQLGGVWYQTTVQDIANLAFFGSGGGGDGAVDSVCSRRWDRGSSWSSRWGSRSSRELGSAHLVREGTCGNRTRSVVPPRRSSRQFPHRLLAGHFTQPAAAEPEHPSSKSDVERHEEQC